MEGANGLTALVIGATGMVGKELVQQLLAHPSFAKVIVFTRRPYELTHPKLEQHIILFDNKESWQHLVKGDVLFSALGTTLKQAGSKEAQYKIDYHYQYNFAEAASNNNVPAYVLISSAMASDKAKLFYTRMKGELERDIKKLSFSSIAIIRPGMLTGNREEKRLGEKIGTRAILLLNGMGLLKKQKPIHASIVAKAMINASLDGKKGIYTYELLEVFQLAGSPV
jgi:uncharacterized protein YbjT (DUF2867 family)